MPLFQRYSDVIRGEMTLTGNTLEFSNSPAGAANNAFLSTTTGLSVPNFPSPSTLNWTQNGSTAVLNIPPGSTIEYAELTWGGSIVDNTSTLPVATLNTPITFKTPTSTNLVTYDPVTAVESPISNGQIFYTRSQDVTSLVQAAGPGTYEVDGVPAVLNPSPGQTASAGWSLIVAYSNPSLPYKSVNVYAGNAAITSGTPPVDIPISGFATPASGPISSRVLVTAMEGDPQIVGDSLLMGPNTSSLTTLSGPNNPANNFFDSTINNNLGLTDTSGSFGTLNQTPGTDTPGVRSTWDITNVDGSSAFINSQQQAVARLTTVGDAYAAAVLGVSILVASADIGITKSVDKAYADLGDTLTYTLNVTNNGGVNADNVVVTDVIPAGTTFVPGSITATAPFTGTNPQTGITLTNSIPPGGTVTITFKVKVGNTLPTPNPIPNAATGSYSFISAPGLAPIDGTANSNTVTTKVNHADLIGTNSGNFVKNVDKAYANIGDTLTYSFTINNTGNVTATNIVFTDPIPSGTSFIGGSVVVNGGAVGGSPVTGVAIPDIPAGGSATVSFKVIVNTIPTPNPIPDTGALAYKYTVDPNQAPVSTSGNSNTVYTLVNNATLAMVKTVDKTYADIGDTLTYSFTIQNTGNVTATSINFTDPIPSGTTFVGGSVLVDGSPVAGNPSSGITIPNIPAGGSATVSFKVAVDTIPTTNPIPDTGALTYQHIVDPSQPPVSEATNSNTVTTQVNHADLIGTNSSNFVKSVDKVYADVGEVLTYSFTIHNTGNVTATNVILTDLVPNGTTFISSTILVNGAPTGGDPATGITIPSIPGGGSATVSFKVTVNSIPIPNPMPNTGDLAYKYTVDPAQLPVSVSGSSNTVYTLVNNANLNIVKSVDKVYADIGDTLTYSFLIQNLGNVTATNVVLTDLIPNGTAFVVGSALVNGLASASNPATGVSIPDIPSGGSATVSFKATVNTMPAPNPMPNTGSLAYKYIVDPAQPAVTGGSTSNTVTTQVNHADLIGTNSANFVKSVDKAYANIGDTLTYSFTIQNTGDILATNVVLTDPIPNGTTFVTGSVLVNGVSSTSNPATGISVTDISPGGSATVSFKVIVNTIPTPNPIPNTGALTYKYIVDPSQPPVSAGGNSNTVYTRVNHAELIGPSSANFVKSVDKAFANIGDTLTYSFTIQNTGNITATNVVLTDTIPNGTTFLVGSVLVNGVASANTPPTGISVPSIPAGGSATVRFQVVVNSIPITNPIPDTGGLAYQYIVDPAQPPVSASGNSNTVTTQVNHVDLNITKTVSKGFGDIGDTLTYSFIIQNSGNVTATNVVLTDLIPNGTAFVGGSVLINGLASPSDPATGISMPDIPAGTSAVVTFRVTITSLPVPNPMPDTGNVAYRYIVDPSQPPVSTNGNSNTVTTQVNHVGLSINKSVDKAFATIGDILTYSFNIENTGNVTAINVILTDPIPNGTSFVTGSTLVNAVATGDSPVSGINIPSIPAGGTAIVAFQVRVDATPIPNPILNIGTVDYRYIVDPTQPPVIGTDDSNAVATRVNNANLVIVKSADRAYVEVGGVITYNFTVTNTGDTTATNVVVTDIPPNGTIFMTGSTLVNGALSPDSPLAGINIPPILPGATATVSFKVLLTQFPVPNPTVNTASVAYRYIVDPTKPPVSKGGTSNAVNVQAEQVNLTAVKSVDKTNALAGEVVTYTIVVSNNGTVTALNTIFTDSIPTGTTFVPDSVTVNGSPRTGTNPSTGVSLGTVTPGTFVTITFKATINAPTTLTQVTNQGSINYGVQIAPTDPISNRSGNTNTVVTNIQRGELTIVKNVDKTEAIVGDTLTYTLVLTNTGTVTLQNVILVDTIPVGSTFVANSVAVNGTQVPGANPALGVNLGSLNVGAQSVVNFKVTVVSIPCPSEIINEGIANFQFNLQNRTETFTGAKSSNKVVTGVGLRSFKQISVDGNLTIPSQKPDAEAVLGAGVTVEIKSVEIIKTPVGESYEGQTLTGWKGVIYGILKEKVEYIADEPTQSVHGAHFDLRFATFIVLPGDYEACCNMEIDVTVEDVYVELLDNRTIFNNVTLLIEGKGPCN